MANLSVTTADGSIKTIDLEGLSSYTPEKGEVLMFDGRLEDYNFEIAGGDIVLTLPNGEEIILTNMADLLSEQDEENPTKLTIASGDEGDVLVLDNFGTLTEIMEAAAAGNETPDLQSGSTLVQGNLFDEREGNPSEGNDEPIGANDRRGFGAADDEGNANRRENTDNNPNDDQNTDGGFTPISDDDNLVVSDEFGPLDETPENEESILAADTATIDEDTTATGNVLANDTDLDDTLSVDSFTINGTTYAAGETATIAGVGTVSIAADGSYEFTPEENYDGDVPTITYETNTGSTSTLDIDINSINDGPVAVAQTASVTEDTTIEGTMSASDVDLPEGASLTFSTDSDVEGLTFNADGSYEFDASSYDSLSAGETQTITVPVTVTDETGAEDTTTLTITVTGTNDAPVAVAQTASVTEDTTIEGTMSASDVDLPEGASLTFSTDSQVEGLTFNADGSYEFDASSYDSLSAGETQTITVPVTVTDETGAEDTTTLTITVTGTNDAPVAVAQTASVTEDTTIEGTMSASDVDLPEGASLTFSTDSDVEGLTFNADGSYEFDASSYDSLSAGETQTITVPVTVTDETGAEDTTTLTITVTGTNDAPVAVAQTASVTEDTTIEGTMSASDVDLPEGASLTFSTDSQVEGLTFNADGSYEFDASSYDSLSAGETQTITVPVTVTDEIGAEDTTTLTITVTGTNDAPVAVAQTASVTEDTTIEGTMSASDVDLPEGASLTFSTDSQVEGLTFNADGSYEFDASSYDSLSAGETQTITVPVTVTDETGAEDTTTLTITVTGTNDAPVAVAQTASVTEDTTIEGTMSASDVDLPEGASLTFSTDSQVEGLTFNADGSYEFDASSYDSLSAGETQTITVPVTVTDETGAEDTTTLTITVTGTNDAPVAVAQTASVLEDTTIEGTMSASDVDLPEGASLTFSTDSQVEGLTFNADGSYEFDASSYDSLSAGETQTITVPVTVTDETGAEDTTTLTITVTGTNDAPVAVAQTASVTEDTTIEGTMSASDVDLPEGASLTFSTDSDVEGLTFNADGSYEFDASSYDSLSAGETQTITVPVTVTDETGAEDTTTLTITVTGTNDAPVAVAQTASVLEDTTIEGTMSASDVDLPEGASLTFSTDSDVEGLTFNADGSYEFDASSYDSLSAGETQTITVPVTVTDETGAEDTTTLTITVTGTNDAPVAVAQTASVTEDTTIEGTMSASDVDLPEGASLTFSTDSQVEGLTFNADGSYEFDASSYDSLSAGETQTITVPVTVTDETGAEDTTTLTITVTGTNDAPVAVAQTASVTEDTTIEGTMSASDVDLPEGASLTFSTDSQVEGLTFNADGSYEFDASSYDSLSAGETQTITVPVTVTDETGAEDTTTLTITVTGTNDAPVAVAQTASVLEDTTIEGTMSASDVDLPEGASLTFSTDSQVEGLTFNADGSYEFDASSYDSLSAGETQTITVPVTVTDETGAEDTTTLTITVTGTNDAPVAVAQTASVTEDTTIEGTMSASDVDLPEGASLTFSTDSQVEGLTFNADGSYEFDASSYDSLSAGETQTITVPVTVTDETGAEDTTTLTITVTGTNDAPVAVAQTASVTEDTTIEGTMSASDVDLPEGASLTFSTDSQVEGLTFNADGSYEFDASSYDSLSAGETQTITVPVTVTDETGAEDTTTLTITVTGTNDAPVAVAQTASVTEDTTIEGTMSASDVDLPEGASLTFSTDSQVEGLTFNADGSYEFDASSYDSLSAGETQTITVPVTVTDETGAEDTTTLTITVTGTNDAPVAVAQTASVLEDTTIEGTMSASDVDLPEGASLTFSTDSQVEGLTFNADGSYEFDASSYDSLSAGETQTITVPVTVTDETGAEDTTTLTITVTGTNDAPVAVAQTASVLEDTTIEGTMSASDVDLPEGASLTFSTDSQVEGLTFNADGSYEFDASSYDSLSAGETQTITVPVTVTDETGAEDTTTLTITVTGTNDAPVAVAQTASVLEDTTIEGTMSASDVDLPEGASLTFSTDSQVEGLTFNADGSYEFDASSYDSLSAGETQTITVPVTVTDETGAEDTTTLTITVTGTNDAPVAVAQTASVTEDTTIEGTMSASDVDLPEGASLTFSTDSQVEGLTFNADGSYEFDASSYDSLSAGETQTITVPVTVTDETGAEDTTTLTITVTGTNDAPVAVAQTASVTEDTTIEGTMSASDVDLPEGASLTFSTDSDVEGLTFNADGSYEFDASSYDSLSAGETQTITVPVTVTDETGAEDTTTLTITVTGTNDAPVAVAQTASVLEDTTIEGTMSASDVDLPEGASLTFSTDSQVEGLTFNADGSYEFDASSYDSLSAGETQTITVPVTVTDETGAEDTTTLTITVTGTNDAPVAVAQTASVTEDTTIEGTMSASDVDLPEGASLTFSTDSQVEGLTFNADGSYEFDASSYDSLSAGETQTITVPVTVTDETGAEDTTTLTITVTGTNDAPVAVAQTASVTEDTTIEGTMSASDVDLPEGASLTFSTDSDVEGLTFNADGSYEFDASSYDSLSAGETQTITVPVTVTDETGAEDTTTLTITVTGTNDAPVAVAQTASVTEDTTIEGTMSASDVDLPEGASLTFSTDSQVEGLTFNADGSYEFDASSYDSLSAGETQTITVPVTVTDETGAEDTTTLTITVTGTNDAPVAVAQTASVTEDTTIEGTMSASDVDLPEGASLTFSTDSQVEGLTFNADGSYEFDASSYDSLSAGETQTITVPVTVTDETGAEDTTTLTITVTGTNDAPVAVAQTASVLEDTTIEGTMSASDVDLPEGASLTFSTDSQVEGLTFNADGSYEFDASSYDSLSAGETQTITVPVTVTDETGAEDTTTLTITVTGTNDAPVAVAQTASVTEDTTIEGTMSASDVDLPEGASLTFSTDSQVEGLTFNADGSYEFDASSYDSLSAGETQTITVPVTVTDETGAEDTTTLTITVTGTNDAPVAVAQTASVLEDTTIEGTMSASDVDLPEGASLTFSTDSQVEGLTFNADGSYEFDASSYDSLSAGETQTITVPVTVTDETGAEDTTTLTITVTGTNDAPVAVAQTASVLEDTTIEGTMSASDVDLPEGASLTFSTDSQVEGLTFNADGSYEFDASSYDSLSAGETQTITVPVTVTDETGAEDTTTLTITVTGTNDAPVAVAQTASVTEDTTIEGTMSASDVDLPEGASLTFSTDSQVEGLTFNADGSYEFDASSYDSLSAGETQTITVPVTVTDETGAEDTTTLTITVTGTNDAPVAVAQTASVLEDTTIEGTMSASDVDLPEGASLTFSTDSQVEGLTFNADGSYEFDASSYDSLSAGETQTITVPVTVTDETGAEDTTTLTITVTGTNDAPVAVAQTASVTEDTTIEGTMSASDVDLPEGASLTFSTDSQVEGLTFNADGSYEFDASSYDSLSAGETQTITVPVTVTDETGAEDTTTLTITVTGTNDAPVAVAQTASVTEDTTIEGTMSASDVDLPEGASLTFSTDSQVEGLTFNADGSYEFDASSYDSLSAGETQTITVPVTVTDETGAEDTTTLTITVTGTNDAPVAVAQTASVLEDTTIEGTMSASDVDLPEGASLTFSTDSQVEGLTFNADGSYEFDASSYDSLSAGETQTITVPVTVTDETGAEDTTTLTITVTGTNDAPVAVAQTASVTEDTTIEGTMSASDVDLPEGASLTFSTDSQVEGLTFNADGSYEFDASSYDSLSAGETQTITVPVTVTDETGAEDTTTLTITVTGTNDAPVAVAQTASVTEDTTIEGTMSASDVDLPEGASLTFSTDSQVEGLTFNADGSYEFDASSYDSLSAGETQTITVPVTVTDETGAEDTTTLTITVTGTNDAPVAVAQTASVTEDTTIEGTMSASDVDLPEGASLTFSTDSDVEGLTFNADGSYEFDASSYDSLSAGETQTITVPVTVTDETGAEDTTTLTITVTGTNDAPVAVAQTASVLEDTTIEGTMSASDVDLPEGASLTFSTDSQVEGLTFNADGSYEFDASSYDSLSAGETQTITVPVTVTDETGAEDTTTLTITVTGTNDAPVAVAQTASVLEDTTIEGTMSASDVDLPEGASLTFSTDSQVEGLTFNADGSYEFDASSYDSLSAGETQTITVPVTVTDETGAEDTTTLTITVTGTNDAPVAVAQTASVTEDTTIEGTMSASDVDLPEGASLTFSTDSQVEGLTFNADGSYEFDASSYDSLSAGETQTITVPVTVTDETGAEDTTTLTITVTGTNDAPVAVAQTASVTEDTTIEGTMSASDVDLPEGASLTFSTDSDVEGLTFNADGSYEFDASSYDSLSAGETQTITVPVTVTDETGAEDTTTLTITVTGTNDAPVAVAQTASVLEDTTIEGTMSASDVDLPEGASLTFSTDSQVEGLTFNADGSYEFDASSYDSLSAGETQTITVPVTVTDETGAEDTTTLTITVTGTNDAPVATAATDAIVTSEDTAVTLELDDLISDYSDADGDSLSAIQIVSIPAAGVITLNGVEVSEGDEISVDDINAGNVVFTPAENSDADVSFDFKVSDGTEWSETITSTIAVEAVADTPINVSISVEPTDNVVYSEDNLVTNGSFEDTAGAGVSEGGYRALTSMPGWNLITDEGASATTMEVHDDDHAGVGSTDGEYYMDMGETNSNDTDNDNTQIGQVINAQDGVTYSMSFDFIDKAMMQGMGEDSGELEVYWGGELVATIDGNNTNWQTETLELVGGAGDGTNMLSFKEVGTGEDNGGIAIDNVFMAPVETMIEYDVDVSAMLADTDGSETLSVVLSGLPEGATLSVGEAGENGTWVIETDGTSIDLTDVKMYIPESADEFTITATAVATDSNGDTASASATDLVENVVLNDAATSTDDSVTATEDQVLTLSVNDFGDYSDANGDSFASVQFTTVPENGTLKLLGQDGEVIIEAGDEVSVADIEFGNLVFVPDANSSETGSFDFRVGDGHEYSEESYTTTVSIDAVADAPEISISIGTPTIETIEGGGTFTPVEGLAAKSLSGFESDNNIAEGTTSTKTFDFGSEYAGKTVTLTFDTDVEGGRHGHYGWDSGYDYFNISANGTLIDTLDDRSELDADGYGNDQAHSYQVTLDDQGKVVISMQADSETSYYDNESVDVSNVTLTYEGGNSWNGNGVNEASDGDITIAQDATATKTFNFGTEHAGETVQISFNYTTSGGWESSGGYADALNVSVNGTTDTKVDQNWDGVGSDTGVYTTTAVVGADGTVTVGINPNTTGSNETIEISNFNIVGTDTDVDVYNYPIDIDAALGADVDGSETLGDVTLSGVPAGATVVITDVATEATTEYTADENGVVTLTQSEVSDANTISLQLPVTADQNFELNASVTSTEASNDDSATATASAEHASVDDAPETTDEEVTVKVDSVSSTSQDTNIVMVLDLSGSMNWDGDSQTSGTQSRLEIAKDAIEEMIEAYDDLGDVNIKLTVFSSEGSSSVWMSAEDAIDTIDNLSAYGATNYEDALYETYNNYSEPAADRTVGFFISDGEPTTENKEGRDVRGNIGRDSESGWIDSDYQEAWTAFVNENLDELNVIGIGDGITNTTYLDQLAQGINSTVTVNTMHIVDVTELGENITPNVNVVEGTLSDNIDYGADGAGGISSIAVGGVVYTAATFPADGVTTPEGGTLTFDFSTGDYTYTTVSTVQSDTQEVFTVTVADADGDTATLDLTMNLDVDVSAPSLDMDIVEVSSGSGALEGLDLNGYTTHDVGDLGMNQNISTENAKDYVVIGDTAGGTNINGGNGNDIVQINGDINGNTSYNGGNGTDTLILGKSEDSYTINNYTNNNGVISAQIIDNETGQTLTVNNIEQIRYGGASSEYEYQINLDAAATDSNSTLSDVTVTLNELPDGAVLKDGNGDPITANDDGTYTINLDSSGDASVTLVSATALSEDQIDGINASVTATEIDGDGDTSTTIVSEDDTLATLETDGEDGYETLFIEDDMNFDFDGLAQDQTSSLNEINMTGGSEGSTLEGLDAQDFITSGTDSTDAEIMKILGDENDEVKLDVTGENGEDATWTKTDDQVTDEDGNTFDIYQGGTGDDQVTLYIDNDVVVTDI